MVYQRKQRAYEQEQQQHVPTVQTSLFNSPDLETEEADNAFSVTSSQPGPSLEVRRQQASKPFYTLESLVGSRPVYPPSSSAVQRHPMFPLEQEQHTGSLDSHWRHSATRHDFFGSGKPAVQRDVMADEAAVQKAPEGEAGGAGAVELTPKGSGSPLPKQVSDNFVQSGYPEVKDARVHVDDGATQSIQAKAYTQKNNIVVRSSGANDPKLLGHEATHVVQQSQMALKPDVNGTPINANRALEKNADDNGERVARREPVKVEGVNLPDQPEEVIGGAALNQSVQRQMLEPQHQGVIQRLLETPIKVGASMKRVMGTPEAEAYLKKQKIRNVTEDDIKTAVDVLAHSHQTWGKSDLISAVKAVAWKRPVGPFSPDLREAKNKPQANQNNNQNANSDSGISESKNKAKEKRKNKAKEKRKKKYAEKVNSKIKHIDNKVAAGIGNLSKQENPKVKIIKGVPVNKEYPGQKSLINKLAEIYDHIAKRIGQQSANQGIPVERPSLDIGGMCNGLAAYWMFHKMGDKDKEYFADVIENIQSFREVIKDLDLHILNLHEKMKFRASKLPIQKLAKNKDPLGVYGSFRGDFNNIFKNSERNDDEHDNDLEVFDNFNIDDDDDDEKAFSHFNIDDNANDTNYQSYTNANDTSVSVNLPPQHSNDDDQTTNDNYDNYHNYDNYDYGDYSNDDDSNYGASPYQDIPVKKEDMPIFNSNGELDENNIGVSINLPPQHLDDADEFDFDADNFNIDAHDKLENEEDEDNENSEITSVPNHQSSLDKNDIGNLVNQVSQHFNDDQNVDNKFADYADYAYGIDESDGSYSDDDDGIYGNYGASSHQAIPVGQGDMPISSSKDGLDENKPSQHSVIPIHSNNANQKIVGDSAGDQEILENIDSGLANSASISLDQASDKATGKHAVKKEGGSQKPKVDYKFIGFESSNSEDNVVGVYKQMDEFTQRIIWLFRPDSLKDSKKHILGMENPRRQPSAAEHYPPERKGDKVTDDAEKYTGLTQNDIVDLIGSDLVEQVTSISFPFKSDTLVKVFPRVIKPGHMIHITSDIHAFAVVCKEEAIFLYEPTSGFELKFSYNELEPLSERILYYGQGNNSKNINLNVLRRKDIKSQGQEQINPLDLAKTSNISPGDQEQAYEAFTSALAYGQIDLIKHYVENYNLDLNQPLKKVKAKDRPPLLHAIKNASQTHQDKASEIVIYLLSKGANVNVSVAHGTLLTIAADRGLDRVMQVLLSHPGFKYSRDVNEAIGYAIEYDHRHIVAAALNNPNFPLKSQVVVKAIQYAVEYGYPGILDLALKQKCLDQDDRRAKILATIPKDFSDSNKKVEKEEKEEILDLNLPSGKSSSLKKLAPIDKDFIAPSDVDKQKKVDLNLPAHAVKGLGELLIDQAYKTAGKELVESIYNAASAEGINKAEDLQKIAKIGGTKEIVWKFLAKLANESKLKTVLDPLAGKDILQHWAPEITDTFKAAYLNDIQYSSAFLDNAEGQALSQILGVNARVFALPGQQPGKKFITPDGDRYEAIKVTPADGHCLIHGMYLIKDDKPASPEEIWEARRQIANNINQNDLELQLQGYIGDALSGLPQASGLGDRTKALLQSNSAISQGKDEKAKPKSPLKKKKEKEKLPKEKLPEVNPEIPFGYQRIFPNTVYGDENNLHGYLVFVNRNHYVQVVPEGPQQVGLGNNDNHNKSQDKKQSKSQDEEHNKSKLKKDKVSKYKSTEELLVILNDMQTTMGTTLWDKVLQLKGKVEHTVTGAITKYLKEHGVSIVEFQSTQVKIKDAHTNHQPLKDMVKQVYDYYTDQ